VSVPTITELRDALAASLDAIDGFRGLSYFPQPIPTPCAVVAGPSIDFDEDTLTDRYSFPVLVLVADSDNRVSQVTLDSYLSSSGANSVRDAIYADGTLGGLAQYVQVVNLRDYGIHEVQNVRYIGAIFEVDVVAFR